MSVKKHLDSYKGRLNSTQITEGINAARQNALRLIEDAQTLFNNARYPSAASLAILSIEESGKEPILRQLSTVASHNELSSLWKNYRSHISKNVMWLLPQLFQEGARQLDDFRDIFKSDAEHPYLLDQLKQISFYTDCLGKAHWSKPWEIIDEELAEALIRIAMLFIESRVMEVQEIELWIKHMGREKNNDLKSQKEALMRWYAEMVELELTPEKSNFKNFVKWLGLSMGD